MFLRRAVGTYHLLRRRERFLSSFIPRVVKIIQIQKNKRAFIVFQLTPYWLLKDALLRSY